MMPNNYRANWMKYKNKITKWMIKAYKKLITKLHSQGGESHQPPWQYPAGCHLQLGMQITAALTVAATLMLYCRLSRSVNTLPAGRVTHRAASVLFMINAVLLAAVVAASKTNAEK